MNGKSVVVVLVLDAIVMVVDGGRVVGYEWYGCFVSMLGCWWVEVVSKVMLLFCFLLPLWKKRDQITPNCQREQKKRRKGEEERKIDGQYNYAKCVRLINISIVLVLLQSF